ncbi:MAG: hypothetical protein DDT34_01406 [Firmicutes bacterium]|nr:hypothetical protein [Bacillota bacterium]
MLALPESGMAVSRTQHNINLDYLCDWIESSALFGDEPVSMSEITDLLIEHEVYREQDFADEVVGIAWGILRRRYRALGSPLGFHVSGTRIKKTAAWTAHPSYAFCMMLACSTYLYPAAMFRHRAVNTQGELFERLSVESLVEMLPGWKVEPIGWTPTNPTKLKGSIDGIIANLREVAGAEKDMHVTAHSNEIGLDILAFLAFDDPSAALPVLMVQCASGDDWKRKRKTPDLAIWEKVISFISKPTKGFVMPYAFAEPGDFRKEATSVQGVFFDRYRLLAPSPTKRAWVSATLNSDLVSYVSARVPHLPEATVAI